MRNGLMALALLFATDGAFAQTPLYWALTNNDVAELWSQTETDPLPDLLDETGLTPPAWAVGRGNAEVVTELLWRGFPLDEIDADGRNLLFSAAALGRVDLFDTILAAGAPWDQVDNNGQTLIHAAASSPHPEMLEKLLVLGLGATELSSSGVTPLMLACLAGKADHSAVLLAWGAIAEDQDYLGRSVRDYAVRGGDKKTLDLIDAALTPWTIEQDGEVPPP